MKNFIKKHKVDIIAFCLMFIPIFFVMLWSPWSSDDLIFTGFHFKNFKEMLDMAFYYGNGRFLGNLGDFYLLYHPIINVLVKSIVITMTFIMIPKVLKFDNGIDYLLSFFFMFGITSSIFSEVYQWTSGFQNYVPPVLLLLFCIYIWNKYTENKNVLYLVLIFILGLISQLYIEHCTVANIIISFAALSYSFIKKNNKKLLSLFWFLGTTIGTIIMFLIPKLFYLEQNKVTGYRGFDINILSIIGKFIILESVFMENILLLVSLSLLLIIIIKNSKDSWKNKKYPLLIQIFLKIFILATVFIHVVSVLKLEHLFSIKYDISGITFSIFLLVLIEVIIHINDEQVRNKLKLCFGSAILFTGPILFVNPTGCRMLFTMYVCFVMGTITLFNYCLKNGWISNYKIIKNIIILISVFLSCYMIITFNKISKVDKQNHTYIQEQMKLNKTKIKIPIYPSEYVHTDGCAALILGEHYYYKDCGDIEFEMMDYDEWIKFIKNESTERN